MSSEGESYNPLIQELKRHSYERPVRKVYLAAQYLAPEREREREREGERARERNVR